MWVSKPQTRFLSFFVGSFKIDVSKLFGYFYYVLCQGWGFDFLKCLTLLKPLLNGVNVLLT